MTPVAPRRGTSLANPSTVSLLGILLATVALLPWLLHLSPLHAVLCVTQVSLATAGAVRSAYPVLRPTALIAFVFTLSWLGVAPVYQLAHNTAAWGDSAVLI